MTFIFDSLHSMLSVINLPSLCTDNEFANQVDRGDKEQFVAEHDIFHPLIHLPSDTVSFPSTHLLNNSVL